MLIIDEFSFKIDINNKPTLVITNPIKVKISEPILSDKCPLNGATTAKINGYIISTNPVVDGESFITS